VDSFFPGRLNSFSILAGPSAAKRLAAGFIRGEANCDNIISSTIDESQTICPYSDTWQLVINTCTTIITFLMVFLIQNTQNRDAKAMQLKLDELIFSMKGARNEMLDIEELTDEQLESIAEAYRKKKEACTVYTVDALKEDRA
jgi:low affinity Fe/Cu permease